MQPKPSVLRDSTLYFGSQLGARALNFLYFLILARTLPTDEFGVLNYVLSVIIVLDIFIDLGLSRHALREISKNPDRTGEFVTRLLPYKMLASTVTFAGFCLWVGLSDQIATYKMISIFSALGLFFGSPAMLLENVMQAHHRFALISMANIALSVVQFALGGTIILAGGSTVMISFTFVVTYFIYASIMAWGVWQLRPRFEPRWNLTGLVSSLPAAFPYLLSALIIMLAIRAEFLVFGYFGSPVELGLFGMATKITEAGMLLPLTLTTVMAPRFAKAHAMPRQTLTHLYFSGIEVLLSVVLLATIIAYMLIPIVPVLLAEPEFQNIDTVLQIIFLGYPAACVFVFNTAVLFGAAKQRGPLFILTGLAAVQIGVNILLQSKYGMFGAAGSFVVFMAIAALASTIFILALYAQFSGYWRAFTGPSAGAFFALCLYFVLPFSSETLRLLGAMVVFVITVAFVRKTFPAHVGRIDLNL